MSHTESHQEIEDWSNKEQHQKIEDYGEEHQKKEDGNSEEIDEQQEKEAKKDAFRTQRFTITLILNPIRRDIPRQIS